MRHLFATFLAFLVLLPSLACAMPICLMSQSTSESTLCHDQMDNDRLNVDGFMILQDCTGVDFQVSENVPDLGIKDKSKDTLDPNAIIVETNYPPILTTKSSPRAPPVRLGALFIEPSLILTTQRFRI